MPHLCQLESNDTDQELRNNCINCLSAMSRSLMKRSDLPTILNIVKNICSNGWWRARIAALCFLQVMVFNNIFSVVECNTSITLVQEVVLDSLKDSRPEVRQMAAQVLSGLFHIELIKPDKLILVSFDCL